MYGGRPRLPRGASEALIAMLRGFPRQALHAQALGLVHPGNGQACRFEAPLPADMRELLNVLETEDPPLGSDSDPD